MPDAIGEVSLVLLDACCLINLLATGRCEEILGRLPYRFATSRLVADREVLSQSLEPMENLALLDLATEDELACFARFAADLDDGEASVCALAVARGATVATDDRKALRVLGQVAPGIASLQTPEILYAWAHLTRATERDIAETLLAVRQRGRFHPRRDAPRFEWWEGFFR